MTEKVWNIVKRIPSGKVSTYGAIAKIAGVSPRLVGRVLHANPDPEAIPCHRVVDRTGRIAPSFAFGGAKEQRARLISEGVSFKDKMHVDIKRHLWS